MQFQRPYDEKGSIEVNFKGRIDRLREYMETAGITVSIIVAPVNQYYLSGFETITYSRPILTVIDRERCSMILPGIEESWGREISIADDFYPYFETPLDVSRGTSAMGHLESLIRKYPQGTRVGVEMGVMACSVGDALRAWGYELADVLAQISRMRSIKDAEEIAVIAKAARLVCTAVRETALAAHAGATELDIETAGINAAKAEALQIYPASVVGSGLSMCISGIERTVMPHILTGPRKIEDGDVVLNTRQLALDGYYADCQRTFFVGGHRTKKQQEVYDTLRRAQETAIGMIKPGAKAAEVEHASRKIIDDAGYAPYFSHRLGKSSGLEALEEPYLRFDSDYELVSGMIFNVLPSVYIPGIGGSRISDTVLVTEGGHRILTDSCSRELDDLVAH